MGASLSEGIRLVEDTRTFETHAMIGFNYRFHPLAVRLRQRMKKDPEMVRHVRSVFSTAPRPLPAWKQKRASGGGVLLDLASHHFDLLRFLLDAEVVSVSARTWSERSEEDCCEGELVFSNGVRVDMLYSFCRSEQDRIELSGPRHRLLLNRYAPLTYPCRPVGEFVRYQWERRHSPWKEVSFRRSLSAWIESIRTGSLPPVTLADGLESLRVVDAAERSAHIGRPVVINRLANREAAR